MFGHHRRGRHRVYVTSAGLAEAAPDYSRGREIISALGCFVLSFIVGGWLFITLLVWMVNDQWTIPMVLHGEWRWLVALAHRVW